MGLIKNAVEQGRQAAENIVKSINKNHQASYDLIISWCWSRRNIGLSYCKKTWIEIFSS